DAAVEVEHGAAAVALFNGHGELDHGAALDLRAAGDDAADDAVLQAARVAQRDDRLAVAQRVRVAQFQRRQPLRVDAEQGEVERAVGGVDGGDLVALAVGRLDLDGAGLADDVQVGGDQAVGRDDEAGADRVLLAVAAGDADDDDRGAGGLRQFLDGAGPLG